MTAAIPTHELTMIPATTPGLKPESCDDPSSLAVLGSDVMFVLEVDVNVAEEEGNGVDVDNCLSVMLK